MRNPYLVGQWQTVMYPVLQFDDGDEVTLLSFILTCVAKRQRMILQKKKEREQGVSNIFSLQYLLQCTLQKHEHKVHKQ